MKHAINVSRTGWARLIPAAVALGASLGIAPAAWAGPEGGQIVGGEGSIVVPDAGTTRIDQVSQALAINWSSFNIGANEQVLFNQPSATAVALNRILDVNPSAIFGRLDANGIVFLLNPNGIVFGESAQLSVGGLVAGGMDLSPDEFMAGRYALSGSGAVVNYGMIQAATTIPASSQPCCVLSDRLIPGSPGQGVKIAQDGDDLPESVDGPTAAKPCWCIHSRY